MQEPDVIFVSVLLVSAVPGDVELISGAAAGALHTVFEITATTTLSESAATKRGRTDVIVLAEPAVGLASEDIQAVAAETGGVPIVVLSDKDSLSYAILAITKGADEFLSRGSIGPAAFERCVRTLVERRRATHAVEHARGMRQRTRELASLDELRTTRGSVTAASFGVGPLSRNDAAAFGELASDFRAILDLALEQRTYQVKHDLTERTRDVARRLGMRKAGPRDVIELYTTTVRDSLKGVPHKRAQAYMEEGRLTALELMGHLVSYYRSLT